MKMTEVYKLTDEKMRTYGGCQWELGVRRDEPDGHPLWLCRPGCLHAYASPELAAFMALGHGVNSYTRCFRAKAYGETVTGGTIIGARSMMLVEEVEYTQPTGEQRVYFAILCARAAARVSKAGLPSRWRSWADRWIDGADRSSGGAVRAARAARLGVAAKLTARAAACCATPNTTAARAARLAAALVAAAIRNAARDGVDLAPLAKKAMGWSDPAKKGQR
jgi:hypothetical protein